MAARKKPNQYTFANIWEFDATLTADLAAGVGQVLSLSVALPAALTNTASTYRITLDRGNVAGNREVMEVSSDGTNLTTVARALENTPNISHSVGETVAITITAGDMTTMYDMFGMMKKGYVYHDTGLNINNEAWTGLIGSAEVTTVPGIITVTDNATTLIEVVSTGIQAVSVWTAGSERLATVISAGGNVTSIVDERVFNNANNASRDVNMMIFDATANVNVASGVGFFIVPASLNGLKLSGVKAKVITQGTGAATTIDVVNTVGSVSYLDAPISIAQNTSLTAAAITTPTAVLTDDVIQVNVAGAETTPARGLILLLTFS